MSAPFVLANECICEMARRKKRNEDNVIPMPQKTSSIIGPVIFIFVFAYFIIIVFQSINAKQIIPYEVKEGSLATDNTYRGVALREEEVCSTQNLGYINYYAREGERIAANSLVYTVDETGRLNDLLSVSNEGNETLKSEDMNELKTQIVNYKNTYTDYSFDSVYDFKLSIQGTVNKLTSRNVTESLSQVTDRTVLNSLKYSYAPTSGIVVYSVDGLEDLTVSDIDASIFDEEEHPKEQLYSGAMVAQGEDVYKLITQENWSIVIPIDEKRFHELEEKSYIEVRFIKTGDVSWGKVNCFIDKEGDHYCKLDFTNSMITFATDRYLDVELMLQAQKGLKIPNSAIVERDFYLIPEEYYNENSKDGPGFIRETYLEDGSLSTETVPAQIYYSIEGEMYVDVADFRLGDYIIAPNHLDKYAIGKKSTLVGVYNMNKGYADFTQINILYQNEEYAIVESYTDYGLSVYDHIVLDGSSVHDDELVFE